MTSSMPKLPWALKAAALLWPTPLRAFDPVGEGGRWAELCAQLPWLAALGEPTRALLLQAAQAADGAEAGETVSAALGKAAPYERLEPAHPLGDRRLKPSGGGVGALDRHAVEAAWRDRLASLRQELPTDAGGYARLWWRWAAPRAEPALLDRAPGDAALRDFPAMRRANLAAALVPTLMQGAGALPELVVLQIGPVQSFITAARRTHDLWMGSMFIAWLTLHAAKAVADALGPDALLSPDLRWHPLARVLVKGDTPTIEDGRTLLTAANSNKLHFLCPSEHVDVVARVALQAAAAEWRRIGEAVRQHLNRIGASHSTEWDQSFAAQIDDLLTLSVVSVPWTADALDESGWPVTGGPSGPRNCKVGACPPREPDEGHAVDGSLFARFGDLIERAAAASAAARASAVPPQWSGDLRPKCGVDGEREQMGPRDDEGKDSLKRVADFWADLRKSTPPNAREAGGPELPMLQIGPAEGLSAVSLTRRFAPEAYFGTPTSGCAVAVDRGVRAQRAALRFPSTRSIAAAPYRKLALQRSDGALQRWEEAVDAVTDVLGFGAPGNLIPGLGDLDQKGLSQDGDWLYESRYELAVLEREYPKAVGSSRLPGLVAAAHTRLTELHRAMGTSPEGQPTPYYAVLMLDVDGLGKALTGRHQLFRDAKGAPLRRLYPSVYAAISERLARLAVSVLPEVVNAHLGRVIYCGGDDLLALLPLHTALRCAAALRRAIQHEDALGGALTVSVGIGIGHSITPMRAVIDAARDAERAAKRPLGARCRLHGDNLGVVVQPRSGRPFGLTIPWLAGDNGAVERIEQLVDARFGSQERPPRLNALPKFEQELVALIGPPPLQAPRPKCTAVLAEEPDDEARLRRPGFARGAAWSRESSDALLHRLGVHLGWIEAGGRRSREFEALLELHPEGLPPTPAHLVALLRLARFLRRELPTDDLGELLRVVLPAGGRA
jgi:CRISPR-associated protein Cmr2